MNDAELKRKLQSLTVPKASELARERALHRAIMALEQRTPLEANQNKHPFASWFLCASLTIALLVLIPVVIIYFDSSRFIENVAGDRTILNQTEQLFPDQVSAIVENDGKTDISINQTPLVGSSQPVLVLFKHGSHTIRVLTYSGHRICVPLGQEDCCFDILETPQGGVILEGDSQVWSSSQNTQIAGYTIKAAMLKGAL